MPYFFVHLYGFCTLHTILFVRLIGGGGESISISVARLATVRDIGSGRLKSSSLIIPKLYLSGTFWIGGAGYAAYLVIMVVGIDVVRREHVLATLFLLGHLHFHLSSGWSQFLNPTSARGYAMLVLLVCFFQSVYL